MVKDWIKYFEKNNMKRNNCEKATIRLERYNFCNEKKCPYNKSLGSYGYGLYCKKEMK